MGYCKTATGRGRPAETGNTTSLQFIWSILKNTPNELNIFVPLFAFLLFLPAASAQSSSPGQIRNTAELRFNIAGGDTESLFSNTVVLDLVRPSNATIELLQYAPKLPTAELTEVDHPQFFDNRQASFSTLSQPSIFGAPSLGG